MNDFEKRWQRISQLLAMEATGKERPMFSSGRTLFGIKSSVEEKMDQFAREIEEEQAAKRKAAHAVVKKMQIAQMTHWIPPQNREVIILSKAVILRTNQLKQAQIKQTTQGILPKTLQDLALLQAMPTFDLQCKN